MKSAIAAALSALVLLSAPTASATKPTRGCPDKFTMVDFEYMRSMYPEIPVDVGEAIFSSFDKNGDGWLCGKPQPHAQYNTVDNTSNHESDVQ